MELLGVDLGVAVKYVGCLWGTQGVICGICGLHICWIFVGLLGVLLGYMEGCAWG